MEPIGICGGGFVALDQGTRLAGPIVCAFALALAALVLRLQQRFARVLLAPQTEFGGGAQGKQGGYFGAGLDRGGQFVQHAFEFALAEQGASDHRVDGIGFVACLARAPEFLFGTGQVELFKVELAEFKARLSVVFVMGQGVLELDGRSLVIACRNHCPGFGQQGGAVVSAAGG